MLIKYARVEEILEYKTSVSRLEAYPDEDNFAKFAALHSDESNDFLYVRCRAISSRVNKNNDAWGSEELAKSYKTFIGRPIFVDHNNSDPKRTRGVIIDARLHQDDTDKVSAVDDYYKNAPDDHKPPTWIELLLEVDAKTYPRLAKAIKNGDIDAVSMGANITSSICNICDNIATSPVEYCRHISSKGAEFEITSASTGEKLMKRSYERCTGINFFEISFVFDPADPTADVLEKSERRLSSADKESYNHEICTMCGHAGVTIGKNCQGCGKVHNLRRLPGGELDYTKDHPKAQKAGTLEKVALQNSFDGQTQVGDPEKERQLNYQPQGELPSRPPDVDTLRKDVQCPNCHSGNMVTDATGAQKCESCSWVQPPHPLDNPDLTPDNDEPNSDELNQINQEQPEVTFFSPQSTAKINEMKWEILSNNIVVDKTTAILPKKKVLNPSLVTKTDDPQNAKVVSDQKSPVTSKNDKEKNMNEETELTVTEETEEKKESKLLVAFSIADELISLGAIEENQKLALVAKLEEKTAEAQETAKEIISLFKEAGFSKTVVTHTASLPKVPKLAGYTAQEPEDVPFEAIFV